MSFQTHSESDSPPFHQIALITSAFAVSLIGCASSIKPCTKAGDFSRIPIQPRGDMRCHQRKALDGTRYVNHGEFFQYAPGSDTRVLEGFFDEGKPVGIWRKFTAEGKDDGEIDFTPKPRSSAAADLGPRK